MNIILIRYGSLPGHGTPGKMIAGDFRCYTIEQLWDMNKPFVSCVPAGEYTLVPHHSDKYGKTWALVNHDLSVAYAPTPNFRRYACLIHAANWAHQLQGCIAPGEKLSAAVDSRRIMESRLMVTRSRHTLQQLLDMLSGEDTHTLTIRWEKYQYERLTEDL